MPNIIKLKFPSSKVQAAITTRLGGRSQSPYASLNLAMHVGDDPAAVEENRALLMHSLNLPQQPLWLNQVHSATCLSNTWLFDIAGVAAKKLIRAGLSSIDQVKLCTYDNKQNFFSYRRDGQTGRIASLIWLSN